MLKIQSEVHVLRRFKCCLLEISSEFPFCSLFVLCYEFGHFIRIRMPFIPTRNSILPFCLCACVCLTVETLPFGLLLIFLDIYIDSWYIHLSISPISQTKYWIYFQFIELSVFVWRLSISVRIGRQSAMCSFSGSLTKKKICRHRPIACGTQQLRRQIESWKFSFTLRIINFTQHLSLRCVPPPLCFALLYLLLVDIVFVGVIQFIQIFIVYSSHFLMCCSNAFVLVFVRVFWFLLIPFVVVVAVVVIVSKISNAVYHMYRMSDKFVNFDQFLLSLFEPNRQIRKIFIFEVFLGSDYILY